MADAPASRSDSHSCGSRRRVNFADTPNRPRCWNTVNAAMVTRNTAVPTSTPDATAVVARSPDRVINNAAPDMTNISWVAAPMVMSTTILATACVPGAQAVASMVVDITIGAATQLIFVMSGAALLMTRSGDRATTAVASGVLVGTAVFLVTIAAFTVFQHRGLFGVSAKLTRRLLPQEWLSDLEAGASAIDDAVVASYRAWSVILNASALRLIAWAVEAGEIWLVMQ